MEPEAGRSPLKMDYKAFLYKLKKLGIKNANDN